MRISDWSSDVCSSDLLGAHHVFDGLRGGGLRQERSEIAGVAGAHRHADLAFGLEAPDARSVARTRIHHQERAFLRIDLDVGRRQDAQQAVIRSEEHTSELQSLIRISYAVFRLKTNNPYDTKYQQRDITDKPQA